MEPEHINSSRLRGHFVKGKSGNPRGRPKGASGRAAELKRLEEDALKLAINVVDAIAETTRLTGFRGINSVETNTFTRYFYRITVNYSRQPRNIGQ